MNKFKILAVGLVMAICASVIGLAPAKAEARRDYDHRHNRDRVLGSNFDRDFNRIRVRDYNRLNNHRRINVTPVIIYRDIYTPNVNTYVPNVYAPNYYSNVTYPRTVYLIDAGNSANQLNIINSTRNGSTVEAYITVNSDVYNRVVNNYNFSGIMSISVNTSNNLVTFCTATETFTVTPVLISY